MNAVTAANMDSIARSTPAITTGWDGRVYESRFLIQRDKQFRFPKSKKKRIRNKWAKQDRNWRFKPIAYIHNGDIYAHPSIAARFREEVRKVQTAHNSMMLYNL